MVHTPCTTGYSDERWRRLQSVLWSPDGRLVYFTWSDSVFAVTADGSRVWRVIEPVPRGHEGRDSASLANIGSMTAISLSPDGAQLAYSTCEYPRKAADGVSRPPTDTDYQYDISMVATAGGEPLRLTTEDTYSISDDTYDNFPAWSPDGTRIAFLHGRWTHLYVMAADGTGVRDLTPDRPGKKHLDVVNHPPQWSPDGQRLAFVARDEYREQELYVVRADGSELRRLAAAARAPVAWSPDGERLAFAHVENNAVTLVTIKADGTDVRQITTLDGWQPQYGDADPVWAWIETLAWSPTGTQILFSVNDQSPAFVVDLDTLGRTEVGIVQMDVGPIGSGEKEFQGVRAAAWSPDGAQIALVGPTLAAIVALDGGLPRGLAEAIEVDGVWRWQALNASVAVKPVDAVGCAAGVAVPDPDANPDLVTDCTTLLEVQQTLPGGAGLGWSVDRPMTEWDGLTLGGTPLRVHEVSLGHQELTRPPALDLRRPLPAALGKLTQLRSLQLIHGRFTGPIPPELTRLRSLETLDLSANQLTGPIPSDLGRLTSLRDVNLARNQLTGPIPPELWQLANLETLDLSENQLTGLILLESGQLPAVRELKLNRNQLSGPIPTELTQLTNLELLSLGGNELTGPVPPALGQLANLEYLGLGGNQLTGTIPPELGQLTGLDFLSLGPNRLTGLIPPELGQLTSLTHLELASNQLTGPIPPELGQSGSLSILYLSDNQLTGPIPRELGQIEALSVLDLSGNRLTGCIPESLAEKEQDHYNISLTSLDLPYCGPAA